MSTAKADRFMQNYCELYNSRDAVMWLYHDRCVDCGEQATEVNEIIPRARTKQAILDYHNQVALCHKHHAEYHQNGVTDEKIAEMRRMREEFLIACGREDYI